MRPRHETARLRAAIALYPGVTALDAIGPHEVLARAPIDCSFVAAQAGVVTSDRGVGLIAEQAFSACPPVDLLVVPGGPGQTPAMHDAALMAFVQAQASSARWVAGVCTGALLLAQAGLLHGRRATTHWLAAEELGRLGAVFQEQRVVWDEPVVTGAGVSAGIDLALALVERLFGADEAMTIQLAIEYDPQPPHDAGSPRRAPPELVAKLKRTSRFHGTSTP